MIALSETCKVLGDDARLRLLRLLRAHRLNVSQLTEVLGLAQSGVSRHLSLLKKAGLVRESRTGGYTFYEAERDGGEADVHAAWQLLDRHFDLATDTVYREDDMRWREVQRQDKEQREVHGTDERQLVPGRSWRAWSRAMAHLLPSLDVADVGCGDGFLTLEMARWAKSVVAIDPSAAVLARARALAAKRPLGHVRWRKGSMEALPLADHSVDLVVLSQVLHHAEAPAAACAEAWRALRPGGRILVLDLRDHDQSWVAAQLGDRWMGFEPGVLRGFLVTSGFTRVQLDADARTRQEPFAVLIASGQKPVRRVARRRHS